MDIIVFSGMLLLGLIVVQAFSDSLASLWGWGLCILAFVGMYGAGLDYYESKIPTLQEQVVEYKIEVAELKVLKLRGSLELVEEDKENR